MKEGYWVGGAKTGGNQTLSWGTRGCVWCNCRKHRLSPLSSSYPLLVPFCPVPWGAAGQSKCTCLKSTPQGQTPISPISKILQKHCMCHTHWCLLTLFLKGEQTGTFSYVVLYVTRDDEFIKNSHWINVHLEQIKFPNSIYCQIYLRGMPIILYMSSTSVYYCICTAKKHVA